MKTKQDGGPAFPFSYQTGFDDKGTPNILVSHGISIRDVFAGLAMQGYLSRNNTLGTFKQFASDAWKQADAMIEERNKE